MTMACITRILRPSLLPPLLAFLFSPKSSLQAWLAVSALPPPDSNTPKAALIMKRKRILFPLLFFISLFVFDVWAIRSGSQNILDNIFYAAVGVIFLSSWSTLLLTKFRAFEWAVFRAPSGLFVWKAAPGTVSRVRLVPAVLLTITLTGLSFYYPSPSGPIALLTTFAIIHRTISSNGYRSVSIRGVMLVLLAWVGFTMTMFGFGVLLAIKLLENARNGENGVQIEGIRITMEDDGEGLTEVQEKMQMLLMVFTRAFICAVPGVLIAICYRLDYHLHVTSLASLSLPVPEVLTASVPPPKNLLRLTSPGVALPRRSTLPRRFPVPLYASALLSWLTSNLLTSFAFTFIPTELLEQLSDSASFELAALVVEVPVMICAVLGTAVVLGKGRDLWRYKEAWVVKPQVVEEGEIRLEDSEEEERVPEYVAVVEEKQAPAYEEVVGDVKA